MKTIARKLDNIGGIELNNKQKSQLTGGEDTVNCYYCVCFLTEGEWVTKQATLDQANATIIKNCTSEVGMCGLTEMQYCWGYSEE
jgi:hypothetical protein